MVEHNKKTAIVTGGSRGIGAAIVRKLAELGYNVVINFVSDSSQERSAKILKQVKEKYGTAGIAVQADTSDYASDKKVVNSALKEFGNVDVLVNNAGIDYDKLFVESTPEDYTQLINVNLLGFLHMTHNVLPYMLKQKQGKIINITSMGGLIGVPRHADYSAAKSGVHGFARSLALEVADQGITVNTVAPGMIKTDIIKSADQDEIRSLANTIPMKRIGEPEEIADAVEYILKANYLTGEIISPNGGVYMP